MYVAIGNGARVGAVVSAAALFLSACGGGSDSNAQETTSSASDSAPTVELVASGFGQRGEYVQGIAVVTTDNPQSVGEFVTASANFLDDAGNIIATEEQVESFSWVGQELVLPIWLDLSNRPGVTVDGIDVSVTISDHGPGTEPQAPLDTVDSTEVVATQFSGPAAVFTLTNTTDSDLENLRLGVVCYDAAGTIIGGGSDYPELIAAGKSARVESRITTSGEPASCTAFPNYE